MIPKADEASPLKVFSVKGNASKMDSAGAKVLRPREEGARMYGRGWSNPPAPPVGAGLDARPLGVNTVLVPPATGLSDRSDRTPDEGETAPEPALSESAGK